MPLIQVFADVHALPAAAAEVVSAQAATSIAARGRFTLALSGGTTPQLLYRRLASRRDLNWARVHLFWGDERCVPPTDAASNYRMAREALIEHVSIPPAQVHRMHGEDPPEAAAASYEAQLRAVLGAPPDAGAQAHGEAGAGVFDLVLLGLGADGHTASLFPGTAAGREHTRWVMADYVDAVRGWRLTLTPPVLLAARRVLFLVAGAGKARAVSQVLEGPQVESDAVMRIARSAQAHWMVDAQAARLLRHPPRS
jgi:6-phosphogluconolactonase